MTNMVLKELKQNESESKKETQMRIWKARMKEQPGMHNFMT